MQSYDEGSSATRLSLLSRVRRQESEAWNELFALYGPLVNYWCCRRGLRPEPAADCSQEVFAAVAAGLDLFDPGKRKSGAFRAWLWTVTRNKIIDHMRREKSQPLAAGGSTALRSMQSIADATFDDEPTDPEQLGQLVARALEQVKAEFETRTWRIFERSVIDGIATSRVAEEFAVEPATVRKTRSRILRRLRQQLGDLP